MSNEFYTTSILPYAGIIHKICRAYTNTQADFEDYYQEVCLQIWRSRGNFKEQSNWSTWIYRIALFAVGSYKPSVELIYSPLLGKINPAVADMETLRKG